MHNSQMSDADDETARPAAIPRVATFFALYADPLGLTDGTTYCLVEDSPVRGFPSKVALHLMEDGSSLYLDPNMHERQFVSIRFHRGFHDKPVVEEHIHRLRQVVERVGGKHFPNIAPSDSNNSGKANSLEDADIYTVVEMTTPIVRPEESHWEPAMPTNDVMGPTLTRCLNTLERVIAAYRATEKIMIPVPVRERVGPMVISVTRPANPDDGGWDPEADFVVNVFATHRQPLLKGGHTPTTMAAIAEYVYYEEIGHPTLALGSIQNEMDVALYHHGNFRGTVLAAHSASEVLLDVALMGMLYEEKQSSENAARVFDKPLKTRLLNEYHKRLGGSWGPQGSTEVAVWLRDLLSLRHQVAHAGYLPSSEEATAAQESYYALGRHLRNRLTAKAKTYPFTAGLLVTKAGFDRRNIHTKATTAAVAAVTVDVLKEFLSWRSDIIRMRLEAAITCLYGTRAL